MYKYEAVLYKTSGAHNAEHKFEFTYAEEKFETDLDQRAEAGWHLHTLVQRPSGDLYAVYERWEYTAAEMTKDMESLNTLTQENPS